MVFKDKVLDIVLDGFLEKLEPLETKCQPIIRTVEKMQISPTPAMKSVRHLEDAHGFDIQEIAGFFCYFCSACAILYGVILKFGSWSRHYSFEILTSQTSPLAP